MDINTGVHLGLLLDYESGAQVAGTWQFKQDNWHTATELVSTDQILWPALRYY